MNTLPRLLLVDDDARLTAYADRYRRTPKDAAVYLLGQALDAHDRRIAGGRARAAQSDAQEARRKGAAATREKHRTAHDS